MKSKSTSDTCSRCGQRIDKCVAPCPVAVALRVQVFETAINHIVAQTLTQVQRAELKAGVLR